MTQRERKKSKKLTFFFKFQNGKNQGRFRWEEGFETFLVVIGRNRNDSTTLVTSYKGVFSPIKIKK